VLNTMYEKNKGIFENQSFIVLEYFENNLNNKQAIASFGSVN